MRNYSNQMACAHGVDEVQVMRAVFITLCTIAARDIWLIITGTSPCGIGAGTFASIFVKDVVSVGRTRKYSRKQASFSEKRNWQSKTQLAERANIQGSRQHFQKNDANVPKAQGGKCL